MAVLEGQYLAMPSLLLNNGSVWWVGTIQYMATVTKVSSSLHGISTTCDHVEVLITIISLFNERFSTHGKEMGKVLGLFCGSKNKETHVGFASKCEPHPWEILISLWGVVFCMCMFFLDLNPPLLLFDSLSDT